MKALVAQPSRAICGLMHCSPPGSSVHGILQARILEWLEQDPLVPNLGIKPRSPALQADSLPSEPPGKPILLFAKAALKATINSVV